MNKLMNKLVSFNAKILRHSQQLERGETLISLLIAAGIGAIVAFSLISSSNNTFKSMRTLRTKGLGFELQHAFENAVSDAMQKMLTVTDKCDPDSTNEVNYGRFITFFPYTDNITSSRVSHVGINQGSTIPDYNNTEWNAAEARCKTSQTFTETTQSFADKKKVYLCFLINPVLTTALYDSEGKRISSDGSKILVEAAIFFYDFETNSLSTFAEIQKKVEERGTAAPGDPNPIKVKTDGYLVRYTFYWRAKDESSAYKHSHATYEFANYW